MFDRLKKKKEKHISTSMYRENEDARLRLVVSLEASDLIKDLNHFFLRGNLMSFD
jgi:hypothetical protein